MRRPSTKRLPLLLAALFALALAAPAPDGPRTGAAAPPNVVLIVTDDLDARTLDRMTTVRSQLRRRGTTFPNFLLTTPTCCPSRASILRGQYAHNHGVLANTGPAGGEEAFRDLGDENSTLATWLQDVGYRTALVGKYLNGYASRGQPIRVPPGWDEWVATTSLDYFDYELVENGRRVAYGRRPADYQTDVLAGKAVAFVEQAAADRLPFFLYLTPRAPHGPATPAPRHADAFANVKAPRPPSFDEADVADKPAYVRSSPPLTAAEIAGIDAAYRDRLRSLLAVDDLIADLLDALRRAGVLEDTYLIFTSDNGYHLGEHRRPEGKLTPYEESIRVPLIVRGPGVRVNRIEPRLARNADLGPTVAALAGVDVPGFVDGRSLVPLLGGERPRAWRTAVLVERLGVDSIALAEAEEERGRAGRVPLFRALRTADRLYVEYETGERELYDLRADPFELENLAGSAGPAVLERLSTRLADLADCAAANCRTVEDKPLGGNDPDP